jgi:PAS domain S-box-containing protein
LTSTSASDFFDLFFEQHNAVMLLIDPESGKILRANRAAQDFYGYTARQFSRLSIHRINILSQAEIEDEMKEAVDHKRNYFIFRHRLSSGEIRDVEVFSSPVEIDHTTCLLSIITDIGAQIHAEQSRHKLEEEYRTLFERIPDGMYRSTPDGRLVAANPAVVSMLGYDSADELLKVNIPCELYVDSRDRQKFKRHIDRQGDVRNSAVRLRRKDGGIIHVLDNAHAVRDERGKVAYYEGTLTDVTELHQAEEALRRSEERYRAIFEHAAVGVAEMNLDGRCLRMNDKLCEITGYSRRELLKKTFMDITHPDDLAEDLRQMQELLSGRQASFSMEKRYVRKDGSIVWVALTLGLIRDDGGRPQYTIAVVQNIQDRKQISEALARHVNELEMLYEHGLTASMTLEPRQVARQLIGLMDKKMHWHHVAIRQYHRETDRLELLALNIPDRDEEHISREEIRLNGMIFRAGQGLSGWVIQSGETVRSGSIQADPRYTDTYPGLQSGLYVPMKVGERVIGSIAIESETPNAFDESDERLLLTLATQAGVAIDNARLFLELQERAGEFEVLYETTRDLMTFKDFHALLDAVSERAARLLNVSGAGIYLYDSHSNELELVSLPDGSAPLGIRIKMGNGLSGRIAETRQPLVISDYSLWEGRASQYGSVPYQSVLGVPMLYGGELVGVLNTYNFHKKEVNSVPPRIFDEADVRLVSLFASAAAGAVYGARLFEQASRRAEELGALTRVSSALRLATTRVQMMPVILDQLLDLLPADGAYLAFVQPPNNDLLIELARGSVSGLTAYTLPATKDLSGKVIETRQPLTSRNLQEEESFFRLEGTRNVCAVMAVPLMTQDHVIGVLGVGRDFRPDGSLPEPFSERQQRLVNAIADMSANALHRATLHEQTALHAEQMAAVSRLGRLLAESTDLSTIYSRLAEGIYALLPDVCGLFISMFNVESNLIRCAYGHIDGMELDVSQLMPIPYAPAGGGKQSRVVDTHQPLIVNALEPPREGAVRQFVGRPDKVASASLYVPMLTDGKVIGLIQAMSYTPGRFGQKDIELLTVVANTAAVEIENARLIARFERHVQRLTALHAIDTAINSSTDMRLSLRVVLEQATHLLNVDAASVLLLNPVTLSLDFAAGSGFPLSKLSHVPVRLGEGLAGRTALQRSLVQSTNPVEIAACFAAGQFDQDYYQEYAALPLVSKGKVSGVLQIFNRALIQADQEWLDFLYVLGDQVALAVNNANLFDGLERANIELTMAYDATIEGWSRALDLRDRETEGHTQRVTELTVSLARVMGLPEQAIPHIRRGALLHDIGKMGVPDEILRKPGPLTEDEWRVMRRHPRNAYDLLSPIVYLRSALDIPFCHHEKWDGNGYPQGLKGEAIPLAARLFAVVDVFDALTSDRPYRAAWQFERALEFIRGQSGIHFDPQVVEIFLRFMRERPGLSG